MSENSMMSDGGMSVASDNLSVFTGKITHAERNLNKLGERNKDDKDKLKY